MFCLGSLYVEDFHAHDGHVRFHVMFKTRNFTCRDNLVPDFQPYKAAPYRVSDFSEQLDALLHGRTPKHMTVLIVKGGNVHKLPMVDKPPSLTVKRVGCFLCGVCVGGNWPVPVCLLVHAYLCMHAHTHVLSPKIAHFYGE